MLRLKYWPIGKKTRFFSIFLLVVVVLFQVFVEMSQIQKTQVHSWTQSQSADCAVVLTGGAQRVREGFDLLSNQRVQKLIISGVHPKAQMREIMPNILFYGDIREKNIILEKRSGTTYGNAQQSLVVAEAAGCRDLLLVTSRWHMHRAYKTFRAIFPEHMMIYQNAVYGSLSKNIFFEVFIEAVKTLFYGLWAF